MMEFTQTEWKGYQRLDFVFEGRKACLVLPDVPCAGGPWMMKTEYFGAFPAFEKEMLARGWHLAWIANLTRWHHEEDDAVKDRFCAFLQEEFGLSNRCLPVGMSCGGMLAVHFAARYPQRVIGLYLDAPVMNLLSCPAAIGKAELDNELWGEFQEKTGMDLSSLICFRDHPMDHIDTLLKNQIPVFLVAGDSDTVVPYEENGKLLYDRYVRCGGCITQVVKPGCWHHPHGLDDLTPLIAFAEKYA